MKTTPTYIISLVYFLVCCRPARPHVFLMVSPARLQFFKQEPVFLSCEEGGNSTAGWSVRRHTHKKGNETCNEGFGKTKGASCVLRLYAWDHGLYWCQSESGEVSRSFNITTSDGGVILESPVLPVPEGSNATFRCLSKDQTTGQPSSDLPAHFYKDGSLFRTESTGEMTIHGVLKSDQGLYKCNVSDLGQSPESWTEVTVTESSSSSSAHQPPISLPHLIIHVLMFIPFVASTFLYISIVRARARAAANVRKKRDGDDVIMVVAV